MKRDIRRFRAICGKNGMDDELRYDFSEYVHELKDSGIKGSGKNGDFTFEELDALAKEFLGRSNDG